MPPKKRTPATVESLKDQLSRALEQLALLEAEAEFDGARGTGDVGAQARAAVARAEEALEEATRLVKHAQRTAVPPAPPSLADRIETLLRARPHFGDELAEALKVPRAEVDEELTRLAGAGRLYNLANERNPRWTWVIGDDTSMSDLVAHIQPLLIDGPMLLADLVAATGARRNRVSGALLELKKAGKPLLNLGNGHIGRWFLAVPLKSVRSKPMPSSKAPPDRKHR